MADTIASKLVATMRRSLRSGVVNLRDFVEGRQTAGKQLAEVKSIKSLVATGQLTLKVMGESAMAIYEHLGGHDRVVGLRNIVGGQTYPCIVPSNYAGVQVNSGMSGYCHP